MGNTVRKVLFLIVSLALITSLFAESKTIASLEVTGKTIAGTEVYENEIEEQYQFYLSIYGSFDPLFEEPYVRAYVLNDLLRERVIEHLANLEKLSSEEFVERYSSVDENDMRDYYKNNREELMEDEYVDIDYAVFSTQEEAQKFYADALKYGFDKALEMVENAEEVKYDSYDGLKKSETNDIFVDVLFGKYDSKIRIQYTDNGSFVFFIRNHNDLSTFEKFKESPRYSEIADNLGKEKLNSYIDNNIKSRNINVRTSDDYLIWLDFVRGKEPRKILSEYLTKVVDKNKLVSTNNTWLIAGVISAIEDAKAYDEFKTEYESSVSKLYNMGYKTFPVLSRMRQFDNSEKVRLEYNVELSKILINYINEGDVMSVFQYIYNNISELEELTSSSDKNTRLKAMEYLYYMSASLGEDEKAESYYESIISEEPYYEFELDINEILENRQPGAEPDVYEGEDTEEDSE